MATKDQQAGEIQKQSSAMMEQIAPIFSGKGPTVQGYVCAEMLAMHIAGWSPEAREEMLSAVLALVRNLIPVYAKVTDKLRKPEGSA